MPRRCLFTTAVHNSAPRVGLRRFVDKQNRRSPFHFARGLLRRGRPPYRPSTPSRARRTSFIRERLFCQRALERRGRILHIFECTSHVKSSPRRRRRLLPGGGKGGRIE